MTARTQGVLIKRGSCLIVDHGDGGAGDVLVFPEGQAHWSETDNILTYKGKATAIGTKIDLAGGVVDLKSSDISIANLADDCRVDSVWLVG